MMKMLYLLLFALAPLCGVQLGVDRFFEQRAPLNRKRVGLITNQTGIDSQLRSTHELFEERCNLVALFAPEHGLKGSAYAGENVDHGHKFYSLHGKTRRPTAEMLEGIDVLVYDIQDVGLRCYTYASTLFYAMEEAAKQNLEVIVLDRPNPINGITVDGPMNSYRSFVGYINIPICHGMTIGELARYFNQEYQIGCKLTVIPMRGWKRHMSFEETGLTWVPASPNIPDTTTPLTYAITGILGDYLTEISIGVGYTLPFKVVGAPWIDGEMFASRLNAQKFAGVAFRPFTFRPFYGRFKGQECEGVYIVVTDPKAYRPIAVQFLMMGLLKTLYPDHFKLSDRRDYLAKIAGSKEIYEILAQEEYVAWKLIAFQKQEREQFLHRRKKYLLY